VSQDLVLVLASLVLVPVLVLVLVGLVLVLVLVLVLACPVLVNITASKAIITDLVLVTTSPFERTHMTGSDDSGNAMVCFNTCPRQTCSVWSPVQLTKSALSGNNAIARTAAADTRET